MLLCIMKHWLHVGTNGVLWRNAKCAELGLMLSPRAVLSAVCHDILEAFMGGEYA